MSVIIGVGYSGTICFKLTLVALSQDGHYLFKLQMLP